MRGYPIDVDALHRRLHRKADKLGRIRIVQRDLADELGLAPETICRLLKRMGSDGRMKKIRSEKNNTGVYFITDPPTEPTPVAVAERLL